MKRKYAKNCFTLIEMVVAFGILSILMLILMRLFTSAQRSMERANVNSGIYYDARVAHDMVEKLLQSSVAPIYCNTWTPTNGYTDAITIPAMSPVGIGETDSATPPKNNKLGYFKIYLHSAKCNLLVERYDSEDTGTANPDGTSTEILIPRVIDVKFIRYEENLSNINALPTSKNAAVAAGGGGVLDMQTIQLSPEGFKKYMSHRENYHTSGETGELNDAGKALVREHGSRISRWFILTKF